MPRHGKGPERPRDADRASRRPDRPCDEAATRDEPDATAESSESSPIASLARDFDEDPDDRAGFASPPCFMHELDPTYLGYLGREEVLSLLNELLEAERAGARGVGQMSRQAAPARIRSVLQAVADDEARFCAMLSRHIERLGGTPSPRTGAFYERLVSAETPAAQFALLNRGQTWVVRRLKETLSRIHDRDLHADLTEMLDAHVHNIGRCEGFES